jgi:hypothetical protein
MGMANALTAVTDFRPDDLKNQLFSFYLATSVHKPEHKPLAALMFAPSLWCEQVSVTERGFAVRVQLYE